MSDRPDFQLDGRVALITGAGRGIGLGIARALAACGCAVAIHDIELDVARFEAQRIVEAGGRSVGLGGDIRDLPAVERLVPETRAALGSFDILVNNAAIQSATHWTQQTVDEIEAQHRANVIAPILLAQQAVQLFKPRRWGRILNIGSIQQLKGNPKMLAYSLTKSALHTMTQALARDLAADNITVNLIAPGYFNTWRNRNDWTNPQEMEQKGKQYVPLGRIGESNDCAGAAVLLCSDAGAYITGQTLYVDGGLSIK
jgi:NAD(P)-dependent dehydrogenase (short-subunit alcohol dehydrogenase family)